jgi:hypothetical protein
MTRRKGSDDFSWKTHQPKASKFTFKNFQGISSDRELSTPMPWKRKFRPDFNLKDFSILFDYNYASMWTRWRRGYELYMYANQAYVGLNYSFAYFVGGVPGVGAGLPGLCFMYPSTSQDMAMRMTAIRPEGSFNFLDFGYSIKSVFQYQPEIYGVQLSSNFGAPVSFFTGEVLSNKYAADGTTKTTYGNYTVVGVGTVAGPQTPSFLPLFDTLFITTGASNSWSVLDNQTLVSPASSLPVAGEFFTTAMRFGCNCPDYLARQDFNLYEYDTKRKYPYTLPQDLKPGEYDAGNFGPNRTFNTRDYPGFSRDFGFLYTKNVLNLPSYGDSASTYSDPNIYFYLPRFCKHIYASFWQLYKRFGQDYMAPWLAQPTDEPMDDKYREYFDINLSKETTFNKRQENLRWWEKYSPSKDTVPTHMMYPDMVPTMVKVLNFDTLASGITSPMVASGFQMFTVDQYNPFDPVQAALRTFDGGIYSSGVTVGGTVSFIFDGGRYSSGVLIPPSSYPTLLNGGVY